MHLPSPLRARAVRRTLLLTLLGAALSAQAAEPRQIHHAQGTTEIPATPQHVVVLNVASLDTLDALGIGVAAVPAPPGATSTARWPARLAQKYAQPAYTPISISPSGDNVAAQIAAIQALQPDLIVLDGRARSQFKALASVAPTLDLTVSGASFVDSVVQNVLTLGKAFGQEAQANARAYQLLAEVRALREAGARQGTGLVLFAVGNRVMPQQPDARFGMFYEVAGIRPILSPTEGQGLATGRPASAGAAAPDTPQAKAAAEAAQKAKLDAENRYLADVMAREPDWIFVVDRNAAFGDAKAAETMAATPAIANSRAWQRKKIVYLDQGGANWYLMAGSLAVLEGSIRQTQAAFDQHPK